MITDFAPFIDQLVEKGYFSSDSFVDTQLATQLLNAAKSFYANDFFKEAKIGKGETQTRKDEIRGDLTKWVDERDGQAIKAYRELILNFSQVINRELFMGLKTFESHFSYYPVGTFYKKHVDQFHGTSARKLSCILYLNDQYKNGDGGELILFDKEKPDLVIDTIIPSFNRFACFITDSLPHEVKICVRERFALTGWVRND